MDSEHFIDRPAPTWSIVTQNAAIINVEPVLGTYLRKLLFFFRVHVISNKWKNIASLFIHNEILISSVCS